MTIVVIYYDITDPSVIQAESVDMAAERKGYQFPVAGEVVGLDIANGSEATVNIPKELLLARAHGIPVHVTHHLINFIAIFFHCRKWYSECGTCFVSKSADLSSQRCVCT